MKNELSELPITLFCIHGNHEARPWEADGNYEEIIWHEGIVYAEEGYPNILFAKDGEIYDFNGKSVIAIGGAYSVDKDYRLRNGLGWFESEQPDETIKSYVEEKLESVNWTVDIVLSHTVPIEAEPVWSFIPVLTKVEWIRAQKIGFSRSMISLIFGKAGMQDIIMLKARKAISELCLKTMMRYVKKQNRS